MGFKLTFTVDVDVGGTLHRGGLRVEVLALLVHTPVEHDREDK